MDSHRDSAPAPIYDVIEAARLYQALYWVVDGCRTDIAL